MIINRFTIPVREGEQHQPDPRHLWASWLMFSYQNPDYTHLVPSVPSNNTYVQQTFLSAQRTRVAIYHLWWTHQGLRVITSADYSFLRDGKAMSSFHFVDMKFMDIIWTIMRGKVIILLSLTVSCKGFQWNLFSSQSSLVRCISRCNLYVWAILSLTHHLYVLALPIPDVRGVMS